MARRVLVVEDGPDIRLLWRVVLERGGYTVDEAETAADALHLVRTHSHDLVLLDGHLPVRSGWELLADMTADEALSAVPVVMITGDAGMDAKAKAAGAVRCLTKPVSVQELLETVRAVLGTTTDEERGPT